MADVAAVVADHAKQVGHSVACVHMERLLESSYVAKYPTSPAASGDQPIYCEPIQLVQEATPVAFSSLLEQLRGHEASGVQTAFVFFHSVFASPITLEVYAPYRSADLSPVCAAYPSRFFSLVDDVYDVHSTLASSRYFARLENDWRNPRLDFSHLHRLLEWRKADTMACRNLAASAGAPYLLVHAKVPVRVFWKMAVEGDSPIYLSHSISQARRNWNGPPSAKCPAPSAGWADAFADDVNEIGRKLVENGFAVQEPTCIDEFRVDHAKVKAVTREELSGGLMPIKTRPWPLRKTVRLQALDESRTGVGLTRVDPDAFAGTESVVPGSPSWNASFQEELDALPQVLGTLAQQFDEEVKRQITARDYTLTGQARAVVVYRPFANPYVPEISGGVKDEMECRLALAEATGDRSVRLFVLHPFSDERKRRRNILTGGTIDAGALGRLWASYATGKPTRELTEELEELVDNAGYLATADEMVPVIRKALEKNKVNFAAKPDASSMAGDPVALMGNAKTAFAVELAREIFDAVDLFNAARMDNPIVKMYDSREVGEQVLADLRSSTEQK